ncbi:hypothetical protein [Robertmurraya kyonggiensis]|uniref:CD-NTase associated protein 4-like DNA endonuclease domain-containing protein n=1 Tax=Robertmurraya kyonggiensis TaxID=1037680 RepID=A0A4U1CZ72_9BACI|nr:hypothetical protein [Robertmurraya kyonggiensis]TKC14758.1 hypothetical protein FA727_21185 [Robertmurraya kyonggiensis]
MEKDFILDILQKDKSEYEKNNIETLKELKEYNKAEITSMFNKLYSEEPEETGGQNALTGYYFQFLSSLYYLAELLEGKWDFIALELHQDIIVGNSKVIRFIQVKSKVKKERKYVESVTDTKLYNGWLQKLLPLARFYPKSTDKITQFELITNYLINSSKSVKMEHYLFNKNFDLQIDEKDDLLKKLKEYPSEVERKEFDYRKRCGETEKSLLSRFSITPIAIDADIQNFVHNVSSKLGKLVTESARITFEDINYLIGDLFYLCTHNNENGTLFIDREKAEEYLSILAKRVSDKLQPFIKNINSNQIIDDVIASIHSELKQMKLNNMLKDQLMSELEYLHNQLKEWVSDEIYALELLNRYMEAKEYSLSVIDLDEIVKKERYKELFKTILLLKMTFNDEINLSMKFKNLLIKEIDKFFISTLGIDIGETKEAGIEKLISIIIKLPREQQLQMIVKKHFTILQGDHDDDFEEGEFLQIKDFFEPEVSALETQSGVGDVENEWIVLPGLKLLSGIKKAKSYTSIDDYRTGLVDLWKKIQPK